MTLPQLLALNQFLTSLKEGSGLIADFESDDELARRVRQALDADVAHYLARVAALRASQASGQTSAVSAPLPSDTTWRDRLNSTADIVLGLDALSPAGPFDGAQTWIEEVFEQRRAQILAAMTELVKESIEAVRSDGPDVPKVLMELVPALAPNPHASGSTALLNLLRSPGSLLFHAVGIAACANRDDELTGVFLSDHILVDDPTHGERPAVTSLREALIYPTGWPSKGLHDYLVPLLAEAVGPRRADEAWERWMYLVSVANVWMGIGLSGVYTSHPYIRVSGAHVDRLEIPVGKSIRREVQRLGNASPLLGAGLCDGFSELFEEAAETFDSNFGAWADRADWGSLPGGVGFLPSGAHYPGEC